MSMFYGTSTSEAFLSSPWASPAENQSTSFISISSSQRPLHFLSRRVSRPRWRSSIVEARTSLTDGIDHGVQWVVQNKGKVSDVLDFSDLDRRSRRGLKISQKKETVSKGTELAELPEGSYLTTGVAKALVEKECAVAKDGGIDVSDESVFALAIMVECAKQEESEYAELLRVLPGIGDLDSPDFWNDDELEMLRGSPIYWKSKEIREAIEAEWRELNEIVFEGNRKRFPAERFSLEAYRWAMGIVDSRTLSAGSAEGLVLGPVMVNVNPPACGTRATARVGSSGGMFFSKKKVVLTLDKDMCAGEEVTVATSSGLYKSDQLLERGVVVEGSGGDKFEVTFQLTAIDRFYEDKLDILEARGMSKCGSFDLVGGDKNGKWEGPENMEGFLRLLCLSGVDAFLLEGVFRGEVWDMMGLPVSAENEKAVCELMIGTCEDALEEYSQSGLGKEEVGEVSEVGARRREMGRVVVQGEKEAVEAALKKYRTSLGSLDAVEYYAERRLKMLDLLRPVDESEIVDSESGGRVGRAFDENY